MIGRLSAQEANTPDSLKDRRITGSAIGAKLLALGVHGEFTNCWEGVSGETRCRVQSVGGWRGMVLAALYRPWSDFCVILLPFFCLSLFRSRVALIFGRFSTPTWTKNQPKIDWKSMSVFGFVFSLIFHSKFCFTLKPRISKIYKNLLVFNNFSIFSMLQVILEFQ